MTFIHALYDSIGYQLGGPFPPPGASALIIPALFGVIAVIAGAIYFARRRRFAASPGGLILAGLTMAVTGLPLFFALHGLLVLDTLVR